MTEIKVIPFNTVQVNTCIIYDETGEAAIVDCGCMNAVEEQRLVDFCAENNLTPKLLLNTHLHFDHAWGNAWAVRQWPEIKLYANMKELTDLPLPSEQVKLFGMSGVKYENVPMERYDPISQGDKLSFGNTTIEVRDVPGHSPGHVVFYCQSENFVIVGDTLFNGGIGRTDLWGGNYEQLVTTIRRNLMTLPKDTVVYPGHGGATTIEIEAMNNPYLM